MVDTVRIPLEWANTFPGVSGIEDVRFDIPEVSDIVDPILDAIPDPTDIQTAVEDGLAEALADATVFDELVDLIVDPIVDEIEEATGIDFPDPDDLVDDIIDGVADTLSETLTIDIEGSLFSIETDFVEILAAALDAAGLEAVSEFPTLAEIEDLLTDATAGLDDLDVPDLGDIQEVVEDALEAVEPVVNGEGLFTEPVGFVREVVREALEELVDGETRDTLETEDAFDPLD